MSVQWVVWLAVWVLANLPALALAQSSSCPGIHVQILNIRNSTGTVDCALFDAPEGFPIEVLRSATNVMVIKVRHTQARCGCQSAKIIAHSLAHGFHRIASITWTPSIEKLVREVLVAGATWKPLAYVPIRQPHKDPF